MLPIETEEHEHAHANGHANGGAVGRSQNLTLLPDTPRVIDVDDMQRFESNLGEIFAALGMDLDTPGTVETPRRFLQALIDATSGYDGDPKLVTVFPTECHGDASCELAQIVEGPIPFFDLCEHHALPFYGHAYVGYV